MSGNDAVWKNAGHLVDAYSRFPIREVERTILERYRKELSGRVLELGVGAGRITRELAALSGQVTGLDISPEMIGHVQATLPQVDAQVGDLRDLSGFADGSFDVIFGGFNVLDALVLADRRRALDGFRRVLASGGLLIFSSHNLAARDAIPSPWGTLRNRNPARVAYNLTRLPTRLRNRRSMVGREEDGDGWALINDQAHDYSLLHFYVERDRQAAQLADHGYSLIECLDLTGAVVPPGPRGSRDPELHYVAALAPPA